MRQILYCVNSSTMKQLTSRLPKDYQLTITWVAFARNRLITSCIRCSTGGFVLSVSCPFTRGYSLDRDRSTPQTEQGAPPPFPQVLFPNSQTETGEGVPLDRMEKYLLPPTLPRDPHPCFPQKEQGVAPTCPTPACPQRVQGT